MQFIFICSEIYDNYQNSDRKNGRSNSEPTMSFDLVTRNAWVRKRAWSDGRGSFSSCSLESIPDSPANSTIPTNPLHLPSLPQVEMPSTAYLFHIDFHPTRPLLFIMKKNNFFLHCFINCLVFFIS